jgi:hypothetical protein
MPRSAHDMPICSPDKAKCVEEAVELVEATAYALSGPVKECECLSACTEMKFPYSLSSSKVSRAKGLHLSPTAKSKFFIFEIFFGILFWNIFFKKN